MYKCGEYIVYGYNGVCKIKEITHLNMSGIDKNALYYVLCPLHSADSTLYLPVENGKTANRRIMTKEEATQFIDDIEYAKELWHNNHKLREDLYKAAMKTCDCREWIRIIKTLYNKKQERESIGKRISASDERFLKHAESYMFSDLSVAMEMEEQEVREMVTKIVLN